MSWKRPLLIVCSALMLLLTSASLGLAEIDKDRDLPPPPDKNDNGKNSHDEDLHQKLERESRENLKEIARLMELIQSGLGDKNTGADTQKNQNQVIKKIEELIQKVSQGCKSSSCSSCNKPSSGGGGQKPKPDQQSAKDGKQGEKKKQEQMAKDKQQKPEQKGKEQAQKKNPQEAPGETRNDRSADGTPPNAKIVELYRALRQSGIWGQLPKKLRDEMGDATGKSYPREYDHLIEKYYKKLAETGAIKGK